MDELGSATTALPTNLTPLVAILAAVTLVPVVLSAQKTSYDYDKTATFTAYKTYALKDGTKVSDPLIDNRIPRRSNPSWPLRGSKRAPPSPTSPSCIMWRSTDKNVSNAVAKIFKNFPLPVKK